MKLAAGERQIEIDPALAPIIVRANRELFLLALRNLHENALLHASNSGAIRWGLAGGMTLFVEDEGPGIPEEELPHVAQRFFRGRHRNANAPGSGLGLAIVDLAVRRSGATLKLRNRLDHRGLRAEIGMQTVAA